MYDKAQVWIEIFVEIKISEIKASEIAFKVKIQWNNYTIKISINQMGKCKSEMEFVNLKWENSSLKWDWSS